MNVAIKRDAVDCARLISIVTSQIHACLQGKREFVFVTTDVNHIPTAYSALELAIFIEDAMRPYNALDRVLALRDDIKRTRLLVERQDVIMRFAEYTVQRMTLAEKEALANHG